LQRAGCLEHNEVLRWHWIITKVKLKQVGLVAASGKQFSVCVKDVDYYSGLRHKFVTARFTRYSVFIASYVGPNNMIA
jgi:hypothetical protein